MVTPEVNVASSVFRNIYGSGAFRHIARATYSAEFGWIRRISRLPFIGREWLVAMFGPRIRPYAKSRIVRCSEQVS